MTWGGSLGDVLDVIRLQLTATVSYRWEKEAALRSQLAALEQEMA